MSSTHVEPDRSVNCYRCGKLVDERECVPNTAEYGGNDDGGELCQDCMKQFCEADHE